jgi:RND family efflux transporter MFP subunit
MHPNGQPLTWCVVLVLATMIGCEESGTEAPIRPVRAIHVAAVTELSGRSFPGRARATQEVNLSFRVSGPLIEFPVEVGDQVTKGEVLGRIDPRDFEVIVENSQGALGRAQAELEAMKEGARPEKLEQLKAAVSRTEAEYKRSLAEFQRTAELLPKGAVAQNEYDRMRQLAIKAQADLRTAEEDLRIGEIGAREEDIRAKESEIRSLNAGLSSAQDRLQYTYLKAPFDGVVAVTYVENFETVEAKQQIVRLLDISQIEMVVDIPESLISTTPYVNNITCVFDAFPEVTIDGVQLKEIGTEASDITRTYPVTLIMDQPAASANANILPGMAGRVTGQAKLPDEAAQQGFDIPESAVFSDEDGHQSVWVIDENGMTIRQQPIEQLRLTSLGMRVKGIQPGEWVATAGVDYLKEGQQVRILTDVAEEAK